MDNESGVGSVSPEPYAAGEQNYSFHCTDLKTGNLLWKEPGFHLGLSITTVAGLLFIHDYQRLTLAETNARAYTQKGRVENLYLLPNTGQNSHKGVAGLVHARDFKRPAVCSNARRDHLLRHQRPEGKMIHMPTRKCFVVVFVVFVVFIAACGNPGVSKPPIAPASPQPAVGWRNDGSGRFPLATPPLEWSDTRNILWTTKIGPNKYSSPIVVDRKIFLVADPALLFCVNAADGKILWQKSNGFADLPDKVTEKQPRGDPGNTTPNPVSDGQFVYAVFGVGIVACYDMKGERQWIQYFNLDPPTEYGRAASPVLAGGKLLVTLSHLIALDPKTGKQLWKNEDVPEVYGTPVAAKIGGVDVVVTPSGQVVRVSDGAILAADLGGLRFASPIVQDGTVYLIQAGSSAQQLSAAATATDKWQAKQLWDQELEGTFYASAVYDKGLIYAASNQGKFNILDAKDGKILASEDLEIPNASGRPGAGAANMYPSLTLAGNYLFVFNDQGDALVLEPGKEYKDLKRNHLPAGHGGTPAFDGKYIYVRGEENLYCIGEK